VKLRGKAWLSFTLFAYYPLFSLLICRWER